MSDSVQRDLNDILHNRAIDTVSTSITLMVLDLTRSSFANAASLASDLQLQAQEYLATSSDERDSFVAERITVDDEEGATMANEMIRIAEDVQPQLKDIEKIAKELEELYASHSDQMEKYREKNRAAYDTFYHSVPSELRATLEWQTLSGKVRTSLQENIGGTSYVETVFGSDAERVEELTALFVAQTDNIAVLQQQLNRMLALAGPLYIGGISVTLYHAN